jgi:hypothetical protein
MSRSAVPVLCVRTARRHEGHARLAGPLHGRVHPSLSYHFVPLLFISALALKRMLCVDWLQISDVLVLHCVHSYGAVVVRVPN